MVPLPGNGFLDNLPNCIWTEHVGTEGTHVLRPTAFQKYIPTSPARFRKASFGLGVTCALGEEMAGWFLKRQPLEAAIRDPID